VNLTARLAVIGFALAMVAAVRITGYVQRRFGRGADPANKMKN
jgi:hypothetical protein